MTTYKGFNIEYAPRDDLYIISFQLDKHIREIVGHSISIRDAKSMIDFHLNVEFAKEILNEQVL